jgi:hypothetical protein
MMHLLGFSGTPLKKSHLFFGLRDVAHQRVNLADRRRADNVTDRRVFGIDVSKTISRSFVLLLEPFVNREVGHLVTPLRVEMPSPSTIKCITSRVSALTSQDGGGT